MLATAFGSTYGESTGQVAGDSIISEGSSLGFQATREELLGIGTERRGHGVPLATITERRLKVRNVLVRRGMKGGWDGNPKSCRKTKGTNTSTELIRTLYW